MQASKPDVTYITSYKNVISIEHSGSTVFVAFGWFCRLEKEEIFYLAFSCKHIIVLYLHIFNTQNYVLFEISASGLFLKYSCKIYSYKKGSVVGIN